MACILALCAVMAGTIVCALSYWILALFGLTPPGWVLGLIFAGATLACYFIPAGNIPRDDDDW
jgi:hypothetical protein